MSNNENRYILSIEIINGTPFSDDKGFNTIEEVYEEIKQISKNGVIRTGYFIPLHMISKVRMIDLHKSNAKIITENSSNKE